MNRYVLILLSFVLLVSCSEPEPRKPVIRKTGTFMKESIERNKKLNQQEEKMLLSHMQRDSSNIYFTSSHGFWYFYNKRDSLKTQYPVKNDEVLFNYEIRRLNDSVVFSKKELGTKRYLVDKEELITGLQEGIKLMHEGETVTFLFPSYKAYGYTGSDRVRPNEPLIYTVELKRIIHKKQ